MANVGVERDAIDGLLPCRNPAKSAICEQLRDALGICYHYLSGAQKGPTRVLSAADKCIWYLEKVFYSLDIARSLAKYADVGRQHKPVLKAENFNVTRGLPSPVFEGLVSHLTKHCRMDEAGLDYAQNFLRVTLPSMIRHALIQQQIDPGLPQDIKSGGEVVRDATNQFDIYRVYLRRGYAPSVLASMFLCLVSGYLPSNDYPRADFRDFFNSLDYKSQVAKLQMMILYFDSVAKNHSKELLPGLVTFSRIDGTRAVPTDLNMWQRGFNRSNFCDMEISQTGCIEDKIGQAVEVDFANRYIGGSTLQDGCGQEEIRFCAAPELMISMLFNKVMSNTEAIGVTGYQSYSRYTGYAKSLRYVGPCSDQEKAQAIDGGDLNSKLTAIDAQNYNGAEEEQYREVYLLRDLNKAYLGFIQVNDNGGENRPIATGNWGCGVFKGDPQLKFLLQWLAATHANCPKLVYYTFNHILLHVNQLEQMVGIYQQKQPAALLDKIRIYCRLRLAKKLKGPISIFQYLLKEDRN